MIVSNLIHSKQTTPFSSYQVHNFSLCGVALSVRAKASFSSRKGTITLNNFDIVKQLIYRAHGNQKRYASTQYIVSCFMSANIKKSVMLNKILLVDCTGVYHGST